MVKKLFPLFFFPMALSLVMFSQSWELEEVQQLVRPRFFTLTRNTFPLNPLPHAYYHTLETGASFPIKQSLKVETDKNVFQHLLKREWNKMVRIRAYALFGAFQAGVRYHYVRGDTVLRTDNFFIQGSMGGVHLTRKYRIFFWQVQTHLFGEFHYTDFPGIYSGTGGWFHLLSLRKYFYYGAVLVYFRKYPFPVPFAGGQVPMGTHWNLQLTFPFRLSVQYQGNKFSVQTGIRPGGQVFILHQPFRDVHFYRNFMGFVRMQAKVSRDILIFMDNAYMLQRFNALESGYALSQHGLFLMLGINYTTGKTFLQKLAEVLAL